ncbi:MAG TPA: hypothetical protein VMV03_16820 [Spirochaetia bacterium]|nr:hypothetical protein [Spirochaetia bacterium]
MKITQPDSRTVRVQDDGGMAFHLPYRFHWKGHDREPVSVVLSTSSTGGRVSSEVKAFFLFGMVIDRITQDAHGISIQRSWKVETPGPVRFLVDIDVETVESPVLLFPGVHAEQGFPKKPLSFLGEKTSYPSSVIVRLGERAVVVFAGSSHLEGEPGSIGIQRREVEDEPDRLHVEIRIPGVEGPRSRVGPKPEHFEVPDEPVIESPGSLEKSLEIFLSFAPAQDILTAAPAAVLGRLVPRAPSRSRASSPVDREALRKAAREILSTHFVEEGGVAGLREVPGSPWLSLSAGAAMAVALRRLFPRDHEKGETALRLADFCLRGQLPTGPFFESYLMGSNQWCGVKGTAPKLLLPVAQAAGIADLLLMLAEDLGEEGRPADKYFLAGQRFVDYFIDEKSRLAAPASLVSPRMPPVFPEGPEKRTSGAPAPGEDDMAGWQLFFPLARVHRRTGRDKYKKALDAIARRFSSARWDSSLPPSSRSERGPDSAASLLAVRLFVGMRRIGYRPVEAPASSAAAARARAARSTALFASHLLPWIRLHGAGAVGSIPLDGTLVDGHVRQRAMFAGYETAWLLLGLRGLAGKGELGQLLRSLALICIRNAREIPPGTSFFQHTRWDADGNIESGAALRGPIDARRMAREVLYGLLIDADFPGLGRS